MPDTATTAPVTAQPTQPALEFRGVSKFYGNPDHPVLDNISLSIAQGEFLTVLGPSGSGKSTLLALLAGFQKASAGRIHIRGKDVTNTPSYDRRIGMVFQDYALFPHMTVAQNVAFPLQVRRMGKAEATTKVRDALELMGLNGFGSRKISELSGGQQQRVALARALVYEPDLLLMDEPLSALDRKLRKQLQGELTSLHRRLGATIVFVTHDQEEALSMSTRIAILEGGRVRQIGTPAELYASPNCLFVATFLGDANVFSGAVVNGTLHVDGLAEPLVLGGTAADGDRMSIVVRPERTQLLPEGTTAPGSNAVRCVASHVAYHGSQIRITLEFASGVIGQAVLPPGAAAAAIAVGQTYLAAWPVQSQVLCASNS